MKLRRPKRKMREVGRDQTIHLVFTEDRRLFFRAPDQSRWEIRPDTIVVSMECRGKVSFDEEAAELIEEGPEELRYEAHA